MSPATSVISVFASPDQAEKALKKVQSAGVDMDSLSIIGKGYHTDRHPVGFYTSGDRIKAWGGNGAFWGGLWAKLFGAAFFWVPGFGPLLVAGPFVNILLGALEGASLVGSIGALGAALASIGVPKESAIEYEAQLKSDRFLLIANGAPAQVELTRKSLENFNAAGYSVYDSI